MEVPLLDIAYISRYVYIATYLYTFIDICQCALKHYCIQTFVFVALLLVKIFDGGFNGLTILNLLPIGLFDSVCSTYIWNCTNALLLVLVN